jgi:hypothetical protein
MKTNKTGLIISILFLTLVGTFALLKDYINIVTVDTTKEVVPQEKEIPNNNQEWDSISNKWRTIASDGDGDPRYCAPCHNCTIIEEPYCDLKQELLCRRKKKTKRPPAPKLPIPENPWRPRAQLNEVHNA